MIRIINPVDLDAFQLDAGPHHDAHDLSEGSGACAMELAAYMAGEEWTDHPSCVSPVLTEYTINLNDGLSDEDRQLLKQHIPNLLGTVNPSRERARSYVALEWMARTAVPRWLQAAGSGEIARLMRCLTPITNQASVDMARTLFETFYAQIALVKVGGLQEIGAELETIAKWGSVDAHVVAFLANKLAIAVTASRVGTQAAYALETASPVDAVATTALGVTDIRHTLDAAILSVSGGLEVHTRVADEALEMVAQLDYPASPAFTRLANQTNHDAICLLGRMINT